MDGWCRYYDLNSGLRAFKRSMPCNFSIFFRDGFSFTSTITLAMYVNGFEVNYLLINHKCPIRQSSINPIRIQSAFSLVRTTMYYKSLQVFFGPYLLFFSFLLLQLALPVNSSPLYAVDVIVISLFNTSTFFLGLGLVGDITNTHQKQRNLNDKALKLKLIIQIPCLMKAHHCPLL